MHLFQIPEGTLVETDAVSYTHLEAERIIDLLRCARNRLEITVANVDILVVIHVINGFMEVLGGWIILKGCLLYTSLRLWSIPRPW